MLALAVSTAAVLAKQGFILKGDALEVTFQSLPHFSCFCFECCTLVALGTRDLLDLLARHLKTSSHKSALYLSYKWNNMFKLVSGGLGYDKKSSENLRLTSMKFHLHAVESAKFSSTEKRGKVHARRLFSCSRRDVGLVHCIDTNSIIRIIYALNSHLCNGVI